MIWDALYIRKKLCNTKIQRTYIYTYVDYIFMDEKVRVHSIKRIIKCTHPFPCQYFNTFKMQNFTPESFRPGVFHSFGIRIHKSWQTTKSKSLLNANRMLQPAAAVALVDYVAVGGGGGLPAFRTISFSWGLIMPAKGPFRNWCILHCCTSPACKLARHTETKPAIAQ